MTWADITISQWITVFGAVLLFVGTVVTALLGGGLLGHRLAHQRGMEELELRKRTETHKVFFQASSLAHARRESGEGGVGVGEQTAAFYVVADMGARDPWLRDAAISQLDDQIRSYRETVEQNTAAAARVKAKMGDMGRGDTIDLDSDGHQWPYDEALKQRGQYEHVAAFNQRVLNSAEGARAKMDNPATPKRWRILPHRC